jgi:hypothetical protein
LVAGHGERYRRAFEANQIDIDAVGRQCAGVIPHPCGASEISECDDDGSHVGIDISSCVRMSRPLPAV